MDTALEEQLAEFLKSLEIRVSFLEASIERIINIMNNITDVPLGGNGDESDV